MKICPTIKPKNNFPMQLCFYHFDLYKKYKNFKIQFCLYTLINNYPKNKKEKDREITL